MPQDTHAPGSAALSLEEQIREAEIERALAPYKHLLTPAMLAHFRDVLEDVLATHPVAVRMLRRLKPATVVENSHSIPTVDEASGSAEERAAKGERSGT
jgi:hypothetical protein